MNNPAHTTGFAALLAAVLVGTIVFIIPGHGSDLPPALVNGWTAVLTAAFGYYLHRYGVALPSTVKSSVEVTPVAPAAAVPVMPVPATEPQPAAAA